MKAHISIVLLTALAVVLGGATRVHIQGVVILLAGLTILVYPARSGPGWQITVPAVMLASLSWSAFLPAQWFGDIPGLDLRSDTNIVFGEYLTGQPVVSSQAALMLTFALVWGAYLMSHGWQERRENSLRLFTALIGMVAILTVVQFYADWKPALFDGQDDRMIGPFPNRSHSGNLFAVVGVAAMGLLWHAYVNRTVGVPEYAVATILLGLAATLTASRAAVVMFVLGVGLSFVVHVRGIRSLPTYSFMLSAFLISAAMLVTVGEDYLNRFESLRSDTLGGRVPVQMDALDLAKNVPFMGIGLGQFAPVFPLYRSRSGDHTNSEIGDVATMRAIHPESDWLWLWVECGWLGVILVVWLLVVAIRRVFPLKQGMEDAVRAGALLAVVMFLLHGFVEVPGHLIGTSMTALFLLALARPDSPVSNSIRVCWAWRCLGLLAVALGIHLFASTRISGWPFPSTGTRHELRWAGLDDLRAGNLSEAHEKIDQALRITPLDWELYYLRALTSPAERPPQEIAADFRTASVLEPNSVDAAYKEGEFWMRRGFVQIGLIPWKDCLTRSSDSRHTPRMVGVLRALERDPLMLQYIIPGTPAHWSNFLPSLKPDEFPRAFNRLREQNPELIGWESGHLTKLFGLLLGSTGALQELALQHPTFRSLVSWELFAAHYADQGQFEKVSILLAEHAPQSHLGEVEANAARLRQLRQRLLIAPNDTINAVRLYALEKVTGNQVQAAKLIDSLCGLTNCPPVMHLEKMSLSLNAGRPEEAWQAWLKYRSQESIQESGISR